MKRIIKIAIDTVIYIVIAVLLCYVVLKAANKIGIYKVLTGSMEDGIHPGDYIIVVHTKDLKLDDIVTYKRGNYYITHRIIEMDKEKGKLITKGDANNIEDDPAVDMSEVVGKCIYKSVLIKFIVTYKFILIVLFIMLFGLSAILGKLTKQEKEEKEKENEELENNIEKIEDINNDENDINNELKEDINTEVEEIENINIEENNIDNEKIEDINIEESNIDNEKIEDINIEDEETETINIDDELKEDINTEVEKIDDINIEENNIDDLSEIKKEIDDIYNIDNSSNKIEETSIINETIGDDIDEKEDNNNTSTSS